MVKFQYLKDVSVSVGLDTAWVDKVIAADKSGTRNVSFFDHEVWMTPTPPWNWTGSGQSGGWVVVERPPDRAIERPNAQYHLPNSWSAIYRYVNVPAGPIRKLAFDYFIDSEVNDYLVVLVNSSAVWYLGGIGKRGTAEVPLFPGNNQVMFAYVKNGAVDGGTDNASVDRIRLVGETRQSLVSDFDGLEPFSDHIPGWYFSGSPSNLHWQVRAKGPHLSAVTGFTGDAPGIDGVLSRGEYQEATTTRASLYRYQHRPAQQPPPPTGPELDVSSRLSMTVNPDRHELYLNLQAHAESSLSSVESGEVVVLIDGRRPATLARQGCAGNPTLPEEDDRKWGLTYFFEPQSTRGSVDVRQFAGTCTVGDEWKEVTGGKGEWRTDVAAGRNADNLLVFEMKMELRTAKETTSEPFVTGGFGLGFLRAGADTADHFPYLTGQGPVINNVLSWETVRIGPGSSGDGEWDGCCAPGTAPWRKH